MEIMHGAFKALVVMQETYHLDPVALSNGKVMDNWGEEKLENMQVTEHCQRQEATKCSVSVRWFMFSMGELRTAEPQTLCRLHCHVCRHADFIMISIAQ